VSEKDITQLVVAYSKTQNLSKEFCYVIEQLAIEKLLADKLPSRELSCIMFTLASNDYFSQSLAEKALAQV
jgi:hypothetical protein